MSDIDTEEPTISTDDNPTQHLLDAVTVQRDALQLELGELRSELATVRDEHNVQVASFQQRLDDFRVEHERTERLLREKAAERREKAAELEDFKEKVVEVAGRYADKHGWCSTVSEALKELDLELPSKKYQATVTITVRFSAELTNWQSLPDESWVDDSIQRGNLKRAIENNFQLDNDHTSCTVDDVEIEVTSVSESDE